MPLSNNHDDDDDVNKHSAMMDTTHISALEWLHGKFTDVTSIYL